jgi:AraC-like DNA-binding protein
MDDNRFRTFLETFDVNIEHEIINMYQDPIRYKLSDISSTTGASPGGIYRVLRKYNLNPHRLGHNYQQYEQIFQYRKLGTSVQKIAELTGYSRRQVYNILQEMS